MERSQVDQAVTQFGEAASVLTQNMLEQKDPARVAFPRGFIRPLAQIKQRWPFMPSHRARTLACVVQLCDVNRWHLNVWEIGLTAGQVWEWHCTLPVINIIEALLLEYGLRFSWCGEKTGFKKLIDLLQSKGVLDSQLRETLHELRDFRNEVHLSLKGRVEMHDGTVARYNKAILALRALEESLLEHWSKHSEAA